MLGLGKMILRVDHMYSSLVLYNVLLGFIMMGLIIRLIMYLSFQKRLSVIGGTLVSGSSEASLLLSEGWCWCVGISGHSRVCWGGCWWVAIQEHALGEG